MRPRSTWANAANYGMGITQQRHGVETVRMVVLRGNIGGPRGNPADLRPFERARSAHGRHLRKDQARAAGQIGGTLRFRAAALGWDHYGDAYEGIINGAIRGDPSLATLWPSGVRRPQATDECARQTKDRRAPRSIAGPGRTRFVKCPWRYPRRSPHAWRLSPCWRRPKIDKRTPENAKVNTEGGSLG
jgi:hypothetical protein